MIYLAEKRPGRGQARRPMYLPPVNMFSTALPRRLSKHTKHTKYHYTIQVRKQTKATSLPIGRPWSMTLTMVNLSPFRKRGGAFERGYRGLSATRPGSSFLLLFSPFSLCLKPVLVCLGRVVSPRTNGVVKPTERHYRPRLGQSQRPDPKLHFFSF